MADAYPRLGISFDFEQIAAAKAQVDGLKASYLELGAVAEKPIAASAGGTGAAVAAETREATAAVESGAAKQAGAYEAAFTAIIAMAERMSGAMTQVAAQQVVSDGRVARSGKATADLRSFAFSAAFKAEVDAALAAAGEISAADAGRLRVAMQQTELRAIMEGDARKTAIAQEIAANAELEAAQAASDRRRAAETGQVEAFITEATANQLAFRRAAYVATVEEAVAAAKAEAKAWAAADEARRVEAVATEEFITTATANALAIRRGEYEAWWAAQITGQENAARAAALDAENTYTVAKAHLAAAAGTDSETAAVDALTAATANLARIRGGAAATKATAVGADAGLAAEAATVGLYANYSRSAKAAVTDGESFIASLQRQAATVGLTRSQLLQFRAAELGVSEAAAPMIAALAATEHGVRANSIVIRESIVIVREFFRGDFSRMAGSFSILAQQGGILGKVIAAIPWIAAAAAVATFLFAIERGSEESAKLNNALAATNNFSGIASKGFNDLASSISQATGVGLGPINKALLDLVSSGKVSGDALGYIADAAVRLGELTGQSADKMVQKLMALADDPTKAIADLSSQFHFLTLAQLEAVEALQETGDKAGATALAARDLDAWTKTTTTDMGLLQSVLHGVASAFGSVWEAMKNIGKEAPLVAQLASAQQDLARAQALPTVGRFSNQRTALIAQAVDQVNALSFKVQQDDSKAKNAQTQQAGIEAHQYLGGVDRSYGGSKIAAETEVAHYRKAVADALRANPTDPEALDDQSRMQERIAAIYKKYDKTDQPKKQRKDRGGPQAQAGVDTEAAAITSLNSQLDAAAAFDTSPLADAAAKIQKAYDDALIKYRDTTNVHKQGLAVQYAEQAAEKERLTLSLALANGLLKEAGAAEDKAGSIRAAMDATTAEHAALDSYYSGAARGSSAYASALGAQADATLAGQNRQNELTIAGKFGADSIDGISKALQENLGLSKQRADQIQEEAKRTYDLAAANNALTDAQTAQSNREQAHTAALASVADLKAQTDAYNAGTAAIAAYERQKAIEAALVGKIPANATAAQRAGIVNQVTADQDAQAAGTAASNQAALNQQMNETVRLAQLTTVEQERDAAIQARVTDLVKAGVPPAQAMVRAAADLDIPLRQAAEDAAALTIKIRDSIRDGFVQTGKLDFKSFEDTIGQSIRKAIYDNLLAKPINLVVNATVDLVSKGIDQIIAQIKSALGGDPTKGFGDALAKFTGDGGGLSKLLGSAGINPGTASSISSFASTLSQAAPEIAAAYEASKALTSVGGQLFGFNAAQQKAADNASSFGLGAIPALLIGLFTKQSNSAAVLSLDPSGRVTGVGGNRRTDATTQAASTVAQSVGQLEAALVGSGSTLKATVSSIDLGVRDTTHIILTNGQRLETAVGDVTAATKAAELAILQNATFTNDRLKTVVTAMVNAGAAISDVTSKIQEFAAADKFVSDLKVAPLQYTDPLAYQLAQLQTTQGARQTQFNTYVADTAIDPTQKAALQAQLDALNKLEVTNVLTTFTSSVNGASHSLQDFKTAQANILTYAKGLSSGTLSPLSPQDQLAFDKQAYQTQLAKARGGDYDALSAITTTAGTYLTDAQKFYASGAAYAGVFSGVQGDLTGLGTAATANPMAPEIAKATTDLVGAIGASAKSIVDAINGRSGSTAAPAPKATTTLSDTQAATVLKALNVSGVKLAANDDLLAAVRRLEGTVAASGQHVADATVSSNKGVGAAVVNAASTRAALSGGILTAA